MITRNTMAGKNYRSAIRNATDRALAAIGILIEGQAVENCPVGQYNDGRVGGRLRGSITWATKQDRSRPTGRAKSVDGVSTPRMDNVCHIGTNVYYAPYVEYGTRYMSARSFLRPAMMAERTRAQNLYAQELKKGLRRGK